MLFFITMPPKGSKKTVEEDDDVSMIDMMRSMSSQISSLHSKMSQMDVKLEKMDSIDTEVKNLKVLMNDLKLENQNLKTEAKNTEKKLSDMNAANIILENKINQLEQHHRGWSARVLNIPLSSEEEFDNFAVAEKVYTLALLPILLGAVERKLLKSVPTADYC